MRYRGGFTCDSWCWSSVLGRRTEPQLRGAISFHGIGLASDQTSGHWSGIQQSGQCGIHVWIPGGMDKQCHFGSRASFRLMESRRFRRFLKRQSGQSGIIVLGDFPRLRASPTTVSGWDAVGLRIGRDEVAVLHQYRRGPIWVPADQRGRPLAVYVGSKEVKAIPTADLDGRVKLVRFRVPRRRWLGGGVEPVEWKIDWIEIEATFSKLPITTER